MSSSDGTTKNNINNNMNMPTVQRTFLSSSDPDETVRLECDVYRPPKQQQRREEETKTKDVFVCLHAHGKLGASRQMRSSGVSRTVASSDSMISINRLVIAKINRLR